MVKVAIRTIGAALGGGVSGLQWVVNAYTVAFAALILTAGALGDRIGAKRLFIIGYADFTLASAEWGLAPSLVVLIGFRAVQGIGAALLAPTSLTLLNPTYSMPGEKARAVGLWAAGANAGTRRGVGALTGPVEADSAAAPPDGHHEHDSWLSCRRARADERFACRRAGRAAEVPAFRIDSDGAAPRAATRTPGDFVRVGRA